MEPQTTFTPVPPEKQPSRRNRIILLSIIGVVVIGLITAAVLYFLLKQPAKDAAKDTVQLVSVEVPEKLIDEYAKATIDSRTSQYDKREVLKTEPVSTEPTEQEPNSPQGPTNSIILYTSKDSYDTQISSSDYIQYQRKDLTKKDNDATLIEKTDAFLTDKGLVKDKTDTVGEGVTYVTYDSKNVICQTTDIASSNQHFATYGLACVLKKVIEDQYALINSFVKLIPNTDASKLDNVVLSGPIIETPKQLVTLAVTEGEKATQYYFATLDKDWEYIGSRPVTTPEDPESFTISDDLKTAISETKWGGFLEKYIK